jgi:photosystem II stability/assembly factor-like uncharacterized protein
MRELVISAIVVAGCGRLSFDDIPPDAGPPTWTPQSNPTTRTCFDAWASSATDIYVASDQGLLHSTGDGTWTEILPRITSYFGVGGTAGNVFVVGNTDGTTSVLHLVAGVPVVETTPISRPLNDVFAASPSDVYTVGYDGNILHTTGDGTWSLQSSPTIERLVGVWGSSETDIYAVGNAGTIVHSTGDGTWVPQDSGVAVNLIEVWGTSATNIYAVGFGGTILHSTGDGTWTPQSSGVTYDLLGMGGGSGRVYAVGRADELLVSSTDGVWTAMPLGVDVTQLDAVLFLSPSDIYLVGSPGVILHGP